jgi:hypothetical protein
METDILISFPDITTLGNYVVIPCFIEKCEKFSEVSQIRLFLPKSFESNFLITELNEKNIQFFCSSNEGVICFYLSFKDLTIVMDILVLNEQDFFNMDIDIILFLRQINVKDILTVEQLLREFDLEALLTDMNNSITIVSDKVITKEEIREVYQQYLVDEHFSKDVINYLKQTTHEVFHYCAGSNCFNNGCLQFEYDDVYIASDIKYVKLTLITNDDLFNENLSNQSSLKECFKDNFLDFKINLGNNYDQLDCSLFDRKIEIGFLLEFISKFDPIIVDYFVDELEEENNTFIVSRSTSKFVVIYGNPSCLLSIKNAEGLCFYEMNYFSKSYLNHRKAIYFSKMTKIYDVNDECPNCETADFPLCHLKKRKKKKGHIFMSNIIIIRTITRKVVENNIQLVVSPCRLLKQKDDFSKIKLLND